MANNFRRQQNPVVYDCGYALGYAAGKAAAELDIKGYAAGFAAGKAAARSETESIRERNDKLAREYGDHAYTKSRIAFTGRGGK